MIKPGICSITFRDETPESLIQLSSEAGLVGIEWGSDVHVPLEDLENARKVGDQTREAGLEVAGYGSYYMGRESADEEPVPFEPILQAAEALGAPVIRIWAGSLTQEKSETHFESVVRRSREAAAMAADKGIEVAFEFHRNTFTETLEEALRLMEAAQHPNLKMYWQPPHGSPLEQRLQEIEAFKGCLSNIHVFHWEGAPKPPFPRLALSEGTDLWKPCLDSIAAIPDDRYALLEFVPNNSVEQFQQDAQTLISWLS
ncbi:MAG: sugar phosphate isomerase/epimerase family protein [Puniceicoccaceae bacterium]